MTRVSTGWRCPVAPSHGPVLPLAAPGRWGWMCPHQTHDRSGTRYLFTTSEVESGLLDGPALVPVRQALSETSRAEASTGDKSMRARPPLSTGAAAPVPPAGQPRPRREDALSRRAAARR